MKKGVIWNTLGSGMFAANSVLLLLIVSRVFGVAAAGDFGIAFTTSQILYIIGLFGINHFQMTDYAGQYSFGAYRAAKWILRRQCWLDVFYCSFGAVIRENRHGFCFC